MMGNTICAFADGTAMPMLGFLQKFRDEFDRRGRAAASPPERYGRARLQLVRGGRG